MKFVSMKTLISDFSSLEGTNCYCSEESAAKIRASLVSLPLRALHLIGTGDYHYLSLFWLERIPEAFDLVLIDHHPDDQTPAFGAQLLSCGSWVADARKLPALRRSFHIKEFSDSLQLPSDGFPVYLSIDLDVLSPDYARTDWDQGDMTLGELERVILSVSAEHPILGADLCGGLTEGKGAGEEDIDLNARTVGRLKKIFAPL